MNFPDDVSQIRGEREREKEKVAACALAFTADVTHSCKQARSRTDTPPEGSRKKGIPEEDARKTEGESGSRDSGMQFRLYDETGV